MNNYKKFLYYKKKERFYLLNKIKKKLSINRFEHVLRVEKIAISLAKKYKCSLVNTSKAALLHDYAKEISLFEFKKIIYKFKYNKNLLNKNNKNLLHSILGIIFIKKELKIFNKDILNAVYYHTIGSEKMNLLSKIIYISDYIEIKRNFKGVKKIRKLAFIDLNKAVGYKAKNSLFYLLKKKKKIFLETLNTYNKWFL